MYVSSRFENRLASVEGKFDAVVVGGGLAGLSLALGLSERGRAVSVLEARRAVTPAKRGMSLSPNGLEILEKLNLLRDIEGIGRKVQIVKFFDNSGKLLVAYDYSLLKIKQNYLLTFLPHELELLLRKRANDKRVRLYEGASFDGLIREDGHVAGVRAKIDGALHDLNAEVVIGADGAMSRVRQSAGIRAHIRSYSSSYLVTVAGDERDAADDARHYLAKGQMLGNFPLPVGRYLFYYLPARTYDSLKARRIEEFKTGLTDLDPELKDALGTIKSWEDFSYMVPQKLKTDSWVSDHLALIGDAAHSMEPSLGQGGSLALGDVAALLEALDACFDNADFSRNALKRYEMARKPQTEFMQTMAERTAMFMNTNSRVIGSLRDRSLRRAQEDRELMGLALEMASGIRQKLSATETLKLAGVL